MYLGARIGAMAGADEVLTSRTVRDLSAGSGLRFETLGIRHIKGLNEETEVFASLHERELRHNGEIRTLCRQL